MWLTQVQNWNNEEHNKQKIPYNSIKYTMSVYIGLLNRGMVRVNEIYTVEVEACKLPVFKVIVVVEF